MVIIKEIKIEMEMFMMAKHEDYVNRKPPKHYLPIQLKLTLLWDVTACSFLTNFPVEPAATILYLFVCLFVYFVGWYGTTQSRRKLQVCTAAH